MKTRIKISLFTVIILIASVFQSCKKDEDTLPKDKTFPTKFKVDIPDALSNDNFKKKSTKGDTLNGNHIYQHLTTFIHVGEKSAELVQSIMISIAVHQLNQPMSLTFISDDDGRTKNLVVVENQTFENQQWSYQLTVTDALSENEDDGGKAMQIFWKTNPVNGIAILKPYNINRNENLNHGDVMFRVDYNETGSLGYDAHMFVYIADYPLPSPLVEPYAMKSMKMFAGRQGNIIDVFGNSHHPNATFFNGENGFNYAFVASSDRIQNIGVAEVGLPPSDLNSTDRVVILKDNSIKNVFTQQIYEMWPNIDANLVNAYLFNTEAPGYFNANGFIQGGTAPSTNFATIESRLNTLSPYNPYSVSNLTIEFK